jgi:hypothetical protein
MLVDHLKASGAQAELESIYFRDSDGNLTEVANEVA